MAGAKDLALPYSDLWQRFIEFFRHDVGPFWAFVGFVWGSGGEVDRSAATVEALICFQLSGLFANWFVTSGGFCWQRNTCLHLYILGHHFGGSS